MAGDARYRDVYEFAYYYLDFEERHSKPDVSPPYSGGMPEHTWSEVREVHVQKGVLKKDLWDLKCGMTFTSLSIKAFTNYKGARYLMFVIDNREHLPGRKYHSLPTNIVDYDNNTVRGYYRVERLSDMLQAIKSEKDKEVDEIHNQHLDLKRHLMNKFSQLIEMVKCMPGNEVYLEAENHFESQLGERQNQKEDEKEEKDKRIKELEGRVENLEFIIEEFRKELWGLGDMIRDSNTR